MVFNGSEGITLVMLWERQTNTWAVKLLVGGGTLDNTTEEQPRIVSCISLQQAWRALETITAGRTLTCGLLFLRWPSAQIQSQIGLHVVILQLVCETERRIIHTAVGKSLVSRRNSAKAVGKR